MTVIILRFSLLLGLAFTLAGSALGGMYRWVDDEGNVVYSQQPPPDDRSSKVIAPPPPPAEDSGNSLKKVRELNEKLDAAAEERNKAKEEKRKAKAEQKKRKERCATARKDLKTMNELPPNTLYGTPDGEWKRFTPEERTQQIDSLNKIIKKNCK
ncbi:DUF4124 domain-containing protein [Thiolapillus sp.]